MLYSNCGVFSSSLSEQIGSQSLSESNPFAKQCFSQETAASTKSRRLSKEEIVQSLHLIFGDSFRDQIDSALPLLPNDSEIDFTRSQISDLDEGQLESYLEFAIQSGETLVALNDSQTSFFPACIRQSPLLSSCLRSFLENQAGLIIRRPLEAEEILRLEDLFKQYESSQQGLSYVVAALIMNPHFLLQIERGESLKKGELELDSFEVASRLSFAIMGTGPDWTLFEKATQGSLTEMETEKQLDRLLETPWARQKFSRFADYWLGAYQPSPNIDSINSTFKGQLDLDRLKQQASEEQKIFLSELIFQQNARFDDLVLSPVSYANAPELANIYGHVIPSEGSGPAMSVMSVMAPPRRGILGRLPFLHDNRNRSPLITRGVRLQTQFLCNDIPPPPADLAAQRDDGALSDEDRLQMSNREIIVHMTSPDRCISCHQSINPAGILFENFDAFGRYQDQERVFDGDRLVASLPVQINTTLPIPPNDAIEVNNFSGAVEQLVQSPQAQACFAKKIYEFTHNRSMQESIDSCHISPIFEGIHRFDLSILDAIKMSVLNYSLGRRKVSE